MFSSVHVHPSVLVYLCVCVCVSNRYNKHREVYTQVLLEAKILHMGGTDMHSKYSKTQQHLFKNEINCTILVWCCLVFCM